MGVTNDNPDLVLYDRDFPVRWRGCVVCLGALLVAGMACVCVLSWRDPANVYQISGTAVLNRMNACGRGPVNLYEPVLDGLSRRTEAPGVFSGGTRRWPFCVLDGQVVRSSLRTCGRSKEACRENSNVVGSPMVFCFCENFAGRVSNVSSLPPWHPHVPPARRVPCCCCTHVDKNGWSLT